MFRSNPPQIACQPQINTYVYIYTGPVARIAPLPPALGSVYCSLRVDDPINSCYLSPWSCWCSIHLACFLLGQDFAGSCAVYPELGDEGSVQVRARDLLGLMSVAVQ